MAPTPWLKKWVGERGYDVLWKSLFELKFFEYKDSLSAAWLGTRIKRVGLSRKSIFKERLDISRAARTRCSTRSRRGSAASAGASFSVPPPSASRSSAGARCGGIRVGGELRPYDTVVSTIPLPYLVKLAPELPRTERDKVAAIVNIGVVCAVFKLKRQITPNFWTNINDPAIAIPGLIEYTNLNPLPCTIVYAPFYMPVTHPKYRPGARAIHRGGEGLPEAPEPDFADAGSSRRRLPLRVRADRVHAGFLRGAAAHEERGARALPRGHVALLPRGPLDLGEHADRSQLAALAATAT